MNADLRDINEITIRSMGGNKYVVSLDELGCDGQIYDKDEMIKLAKNLSEALAEVLSSIDK